jgi:hypothetical protein
LEKEAGIPSHRDKKLERPVPLRVRGKKKPKVVLPDHWIIQAFGRKDNGEPNLLVYPSRRRGELRGFDQYDTERETAIQLGEDPRQPRTLRERLDLFAKAYPTTATWPVRFLQGGTVPCGRDVLE